MGGVERRLAAILSADVQGYSRLMSEDEAATVLTLTAYRELMAARVQQHRGRVVDSPGDNLLAEFPSVVEAVQCAVEIQRELGARNAALPEPRRMQFRIGINLGDVIVEGDRLYGDGVNIAARLESLADPGGVCLSGTAFDQIEGKLRFDFESLGAQSVKNIAKPVRVYRLRTEPAAAPAALEPPTKPSLAVLPFANLSGEPGQEHFSDGMTEEIITTLARISGLLVIASNSAFTYKGKPVKVQQVSRELGVRYVLEGSVRQAGDRVRITAQLIDATTGYHIWAERYDRELRDIFALQDEITQNIVTALEVKLTEGEQTRVWRRTTDNVEAWEHYSRGLQHFRRLTREDLEQARELFERAIALDPKFSAAHSYLGATHNTDVRLGYAPSPADSLTKAVESARRAIALNDSFADAYAVLGFACLLGGQHEQALAAGERALALNPNGADVSAIVALILMHSGRPEEALGLTKKAMRLSPMYPTWYVPGLAQACRLTGRHEEALAAYKRWIDLSPGSPLPYVGLAITYARSGREEAARGAIAELRRLDPTWTVERAGKLYRYKDPQDLQQDLDALRQAGLT